MKRYNTLRALVITLVLASVIISAFGPFVTITPIDTAKAQSQTLDFTTFNEYDPDNQLDIISSNEIDVNNVGANDQNPRLYKELPHEFNSYTLKFNANMSDYSDFGYVYIGFADTLESHRKNRLENYAGLRWNPGTFRVHTDKGDTGGTSLSQNTRYYVTFNVNRANNTATVWIYTDSSRTNQVYTTSKSFDSSAKLNYLYATLPGGETFGNSGNLDTNIQDFSVESYDSTPSTTDFDFTNITEYDTSDQIDVGNDEIAVHDLSTNANNVSAFTNTVSNYQIDSNNNRFINFTYYISDYNQYGESFFGFSEKSNNLANSNNATGLVLENGITAQTKYEYGADTGSMVSLNEGQNYYISLKIERQNSKVIGYAYSHPSRDNADLIGTTNTIMPASIEPEYFYLMLSMDKSYANDGPISFAIRNITTQTAPVTGGSDLSGYTNQKPEIYKLLNNNILHIDGVEDRETQAFYTKLDTPIKKKNMTFSANPEWFGSDSSFMMGLSNITPQNVSTDNSNGVVVDIGQFSDDNAGVGLSIKDDDINTIGLNRGGNYIIDVNMSESGGWVNMSVWESIDRQNLVGSVNKSYAYDVNFTYQYFGLPEDNTASNNPTYMSVYGYTGISPEWEGSFNMNQSKNLTLQVNNWMDHGSTQKYIVIWNNSTEYDVTSKAVVVSNNTDIITVSDSNNTLIATNNNTKNKKVRLRADYNQNVAYANVTVANRTINNIGILPPEQWLPGIIGVDDTQADFGVGSEIQWIFLAILVGSMIAWIYRNEYVGIGLITAQLILFWVLGTVSLGYVLVGVFYAIFAGYQLRETPSRSDTNVGIRR